MTTELERIRRELLDLAAASCEDPRTGAVDPERVSAFARRHGLRYGEAREHVTAVLSGDSTRRREAADLADRAIRERAATANLSYGDAAAELAASGELDSEDRGVPIRSDYGFTDGEAAELSQRRGISYAAACQELIERRSR